MHLLFHSALLRLHLCHGSVALGIPIVSLSLARSLARSLRERERERERKGGMEGGMEGERESDYRHDAGAGVSALYCLSFSLM